MSTINQRFSAPTHWETDFFLQCAGFQLLTEQFPLLGQTDFPTLAVLNAWASALPDFQYRFVEQQRLVDDGRYYEDFIASTKQIPTRTENWHDLFGALVWLLFPNTKQLLNQLHQQELASQPNSQRSPLRHQLTIFDECGAIVLYRAAQQPLIDGLRQHQWLECFWLKRNAWATASTEKGSSGLDVWLFGHANYEMLTRPFLGLTGKMLALEVPEDFEKNSLPAQIRFVDTELCKIIAMKTAAQWKQLLSPLPLLGVPGWYQQDAAFYQNQGYFRPKRS